MALNDVIGQEKAVRILLGTIARQRVPSSLLFSGDSGIGKRFAALNYAKALNCLEPVDHDACNRCRSCHKIDSGIHPDVMVIEPENDEIKIEAVRKAEEALSLTPLEGTRKVVIIDDADSMNVNAANAFLKTLEEPVEDSVIILVSSDPDGLLDTIRSRCMRIRFSPLSAEQFRLILAAKAPARDPEIAEALAAGRPGLGIERDFAADKKAFTASLQAMLRGESRCPWADKAEIRSWLDYGLVYLRDLAVSAETGGESAVMHKGSRTGASLEALTDAYQRLVEVHNGLDLNLNKSITWNYVSGIIQSISAPAQQQKAGQR